MALFRLNFNGLLRITNFSHDNFHLSSSLLQMVIVLHPSRIRHNGDTGADVQQGPAQRFLFRLRPYVNLSRCLLLLHILRILSITERDADVIGISPCQNDARTWTLGAYTSERYLARSHKDQILRECLRREFGLICISSEA